MRRSPVLNFEVPAVDPSRFYENVFQQLPVGVTIWHMKPAFEPERCRLIAVNDMAVRLLNLPPESSLGRTLADLFPRWCRGGLATQLAAVFDTTLQTSLGRIEDDSGSALLAYGFRLPNRRVGLTVQPWPPA
jgi:hypothetical protein